MRTHRLSLLLTLVAFGGGIGIAQQPPGGAATGQSPAVAFRSEINFVEINAVVTDKEGNFIRDLTRDEFEVYEDGKPQAATVFALVDLPVTRQTTAISPELAVEPVEPDVRATRRDFDGKLYILLLDDLQTNVQRTQIVRDAAKRFVRQYVGDDDLAAVVVTSGRDDGEQELTSSRNLLVAAIDKFQGQKLRSAGLEKLGVRLREEAADELADDGSQDSGDSRDKIEPARQTQDPDDPVRGYNARRSLRALEDVARWMADIHGRRKAVVFFSEGIDYDIYEPFNRSFASDVVENARQVVAAAQRANVSIYAVDPRGLNMLGGESIEVGGLSTMPQLDFGTWRGFLKELLLAQESLISLAEQTGGMAMVRSNDIAGGLARIALDNSRYYLLGYFSDPTRSPGKFRKIEVKVKRPNLLVRARKGYVPVDPKVAERQRQIEAKSGTSPALRAALTNPLPVGSLPLRVFATPFKGKGKNASVLVAVEIDGSGLKFNQQGGVYNESIEVSVVAVDHRAKVQGGDRQTFTLKLQPQTYERINRTGVRLLSRLDLPPARYQIRIGATESVGNTTGTVPYDLDVPDYTKGEFALSGIALTSSGANAFVTTQPDPQLDGVLPGSPVATRTFTRQDTLTLFTEVYAARKAATSGVQFAVAVRNASDGRTVFTTKDSRDPEKSERPVTHGFKADVPLSGLTPGTYVLRVEATSTSGGASIRRDILFEVV